MSVLGPTQAPLAALRCNCRAGPSNQAEKGAEPRSWVGGGHQGGRSNFIQKKTQVTFKNHNVNYEVRSAAIRYQEGQRWLTLPSESSEQINTTLMVGQHQAQVLQILPGPLPTNNCT